MQKLNIYGVIENGYCIGCGICAHVQPEVFSMKLNEFGQFVALAEKSFSSENSISHLCPFSDDAKNEDELGSILFGDNNYVDTLGFIENTYAGYVVEGSFRNDGSSGGIGTWFCIEMLQNDLVDAVVHVTSSSSEELLFEYAVSTEKEAVLENAKSKYYPVKLDQVLEIIKNKKQRYLLVGIPCMIKAVRLLAEESMVFKSSVVFTLGLVCGHIKSKAFSEMLGWELGVNPDKLGAIDFRNKLEGYGANQYGITVQEKDSNKVIESKPVNEMFGTNWGLGYFKSKACDFCDDVTAETADVTIGDAWLPEYVHESAGTNIVIVRNKKLDHIFQTALTEQRLYLEKISPERVVLSQNSGINHRRAGLSFRLSQKIRSQEVAPKKRILPSENFPTKFKKIQNLRIQLRDQSHLSFYAAKKLNRFDTFKEEMMPLNKQYAALYKTPLHRKIITRIKRFLS